MSNHWGKIALKSKNIANNLYFFLLNYFLNKNCGIVLCLAGDSLAYHNGRAFTTKDRDNDLSGSGNCAVIFSGAWWYNYCHYSNLNGIYFNIPERHDGKGINWWHWKRSSYSMKRASMKIRPNE